MSVHAWPLPWRGEMVPHAVVDILRGCNIACRACYNIRQRVAPKPLELIQEELDTLLKMRRLSSVMILGGEVTLHPRLCEIVRLVRDRGLCAELCTNGLDIDRSACERLKAAGLNIVYFHVEKGQKRPDLPTDHSAEDRKRLRLEKARMAGKEGLDVGLSVIAYPNERDDVQDVIALTLETPEINYALVTLYRDHSGITSLRGDILAGFSGTGTPPSEASLQSTLVFAEWMKSRFGVEPFACMGSNLNPDDPRWLSYLIGALHEAGVGSFFEHVRPSLLEKVSMLFYRMAGRYPMYMEQNAERFCKQLVLNGLLGGRYRANRGLVRRAKKPGVLLRTKRLLFQNPAQLTADGRLVHCKWCPDAVLKGGGLVPVCVADHVS